MRIFLFILSLGFSFYIASLIGVNTVHYWIVCSLFALGVVYGQIMGWKDSK